MKSGEKPYEGAEPCLFISYSHRDSVRVLPIVDAMRKCGYRVCYDGMIPAGEPWTKFLAEHISDCGVFLPFLSAAFLASGQCLKEVRFMDSKGRLVVPVWLEKPDRNGVPPEVEFLLNKSQELRLDDFPDADAFAAHLQHEPYFQDCRAADADTVSVHAELVTNEQPVKPSPSFVGRVQIMRDIEAAFRDGETVVNLYGMGGIGKSEICRKLFHDHADALSRYVGWLTWRGALQNTLYAQFRDIRENNAELYFKRTRAYVNGKGRELLLFLDNADDMTPQQAAELTRLGCRFLVTSRRKQKLFRAFHAGVLPLEQCRTLYRRALLDDETLTDDSPDAALDEILRLAACHTLTVELLAKTQRATGISAAELLSQLQDTGFDLNGEDIEYLHNPETASEEIDPECPFIEHMSRVFDLSQLRDARKGAEALRALQGMSLLSPNTPIPVSKVKAWLELPNLNGLNTAVKTGWLNDKTEPDGARFVSIHPVIAAVVQHTSPPDADYADAVAGHLFQDMIPEDTTKLPLLKHAEVLCRAAQPMNLQTKNYAGMLHQIGDLNYFQGKYASAMEWYQKALHIKETICGKGHPSTAITYHSIALIYYEQADYTSAMEWCQKALHIFETVFGQNHYTAATYSTIAGLYWAQGDYTNSLKWNQKALRIRETILGQNHPETARIYNNMALVYCMQEDYDSSLKWNHKALHIRETVLGQNHLDTARTYSNIALIYKKQGDYVRSLEWYQKVLRIRETILGKEHPDIATTCYNIGTVYFEQGDFREAVAWMEKALAIFMKFLGAENPKTKSTQEYLNAARLFM